MAGLAARRLRSRTSPEQARFFGAASQAVGFAVFAILRCPVGQFYRAVGRVGRVFMELESEAFLRCLMTPKAAKRLTWKDDLERSQ